MLTALSWKVPLCSLSSLLAADGISAQVLYKWLVFPERDLESLLSSSICIANISAQCLATNVLIFRLWALDEVQIA